MGWSESRENYIGSRCHVCTGCGRCAPSYHVGTDGVISRDARAGGGNLHVVTAQTMQEAIPIAGSSGERLVTADIGTTTIAMQLYAADGTVEAEHVRLNPQVEYGADVLSRIQAAEERTAALRMQRMVNDVLQEGISRFREYLKPGESLRMILAGNTTMIYLLCGYDPAELGRAPFHATHLERQTLEIAGVPCDIFPGLSAFVGGDITAGIYACGMAEQEELTLLIDLGTNGEMALGNSRRRIVCATAAGPAFEGGVNRGIWGADMVHLLALLRKKGIVDESGLLEDAYFDEGVLIGDVRVTQASIRAVQLAKAAIRAGICILMQEYGIAGEWERIGRVVLAGGFGYYLDPADAAAIGLLPAELADRTVSGGNTALAGALKLGRETQDDLERIRDTQVLNLAAHPDFEKWYFHYMDLAP